jgi:acetylornithine deacetylase/succinyl-diaminopimelate desuccinylase-like protein
MSTTFPSTLYSRINRIAADRQVHRAFRWFHLNDQKMMDWQRDVVSIPAPPFEEAERAVWVAMHMEEAHLDIVHIDHEGNAVGVLPAKKSTPSPDGLEFTIDAVGSRTPVLLISAHLDTVFPAGTPITTVVSNRRLTAPGACDNAAGVIGMLALAAALDSAGIALPCPIVFAGNVGEEGEGDLRGIRYMYQHSIWKDRIAAHLVLDGAGDEIAVVEALGSRRFLVTIEGPGGHSWTDADAPNPIAVLAEAISALSSLSLSTNPRTTFNVGTIEGGSAINAVPERAAARFDLRSTDSDQLTRLEGELRAAVEKAVDRATARPYAERTKPANLRFSIEQIGNRPAGRLPDDAPILETLRAVDRHLGLKTQLRLASTDANIPLSLGVPALSLGAGGDGGGVHTRNEWFDATDRELALKRLLLLVLALTQDIEQESLP